MHARSFGNHEGTALVSFVAARLDAHIILPGWHKEGVLAGPARDLRIALWIIRRWPQDKTPAFVSDKHTHFGLFNAEFSAREIGIHIPLGVHHQGEAQLFVAEVGIFIV